MTRHIIDYMAGRISAYEYIRRVRRDARHAISRAESNGDNWVAETSRRMSAESERDQWKRLALDMGDELARVQKNGSDSMNGHFRRKALLARLDGIARREARDDG